MNSGGLKEDHTSTKNFIGISVMRILSLPVTVPSNVTSGRELQNLDNKAS